MNVEELVYGILGCPLKEIQCKSNKLKFSLSFKIGIVYIQEAHMPFVL